MSERKKPTPRRNEVSPSPSGSGGGVGTLPPAPPDTQPPGGRSESGDAPETSLIGRVGIGLLALALVLAPAVGGFPAGQAYGSDIILAGLRCIVLVAAMCLLIARVGQGNAGLAGWALWGAVGLTVLSLLVHSGFLASPTLLFAMLPATLDWLCYGLVFTLAATLGMNKNALILAGALVVGGAWSAAVGAMEYGGFVQSGLPAQRAQSPFFSPNFLGGFLGLALPVAVSLFLAAPNRLVVLVLGVASALMTGTLAATGSRAGLALAAGGLFVTFLLTALILGKRMPWAKIGVLLAAMAVLMFAFRGPLTARAETGGQEHSGAFRSWTWRGTIAQAKANPILGAGPGTFPYVYPKYALVGRTDLAHSSYLQLAAEQGLPALAAVGVALLLAVGGAAVGFLRHRSLWEKADADDLCPVLFGGLLGGVLVGILRSVFDSEWSLLGNGIPFWAVTGLLAALTPTPAPPAREAVARPVGRYILAGISVVGLALSLLTLNAARTRDGMQADMARGVRPDRDATTWPPDPSVAMWTGHPDDAVRIEPSGKRFYQLGRAYERAGDSQKALAAFEESVKADPNSLQTWRKLAEMRAAAGNPTGALDAWRELVKREEGPVGENRAIPELRETHAAFAYAALAKDSADKGDKAEAARLYEKAARVVEEYSQTTPIYQQMEVASAAATGVDVVARRAEVRTLYETVIKEWSALEPDRAADLARRRDETLARLDKFLAPNAPTAP